MHVITRSGKIEKVSFDAIRDRINELSNGLSIDTHKLVLKKIFPGLKDMMQTHEIDEYSEQQISNMFTEHPDFEILAVRIAVSNLHKQTPSTFKQSVELLKDDYDEQIYNFVMANDLDSFINHNLDYKFRYLGFKLLEASYLKRDLDQKIVERPQYLFMREAIQVAWPDLDEIKKTYDALSNFLYTHATPTLFNSGSKRPQLASCFLEGFDDSIEGIYEGIKQTALISKWSGGIGVHLHDIRGKGSRINGTRGESDGVLPLLKVLNETCRYVNQGGKRKGSFAAYLEPWHVDVWEFLDACAQTGKEEFLCRDLFFAMWCPDLFFERLEENKGWVLMCPTECPGLTEAVGDDFKRLYEKYEAEILAKIESEKNPRRKAYLENRHITTAQKIFNKIGTRMIEKGMPYILAKDACNLKSNQKNLGTIKSSNLCTEIIEYSDSKETAVCNLASVSLVGMWENDHFNYNRFADVVRLAVRNLNRVIDRNYYPTEGTRESNMKHRPIGLGVQGWHDLCLLAELDFDSEEANKLNRDIWELMYFTALDESCEIAKKIGVYKSFEGSPFSQGLFQFDLWGVQPSLPGWEDLREKVMKHGVANSLLNTQMPTVSTANLLGNSESIEPVHYWIYSRKSIAGTFPQIHPILGSELVKNGWWTKKIINDIIANDGSVAKVHLPGDIKMVESFKSRFRNKWEIKPRELINQCAERAPFIDQSQSMNLYLRGPTIPKIQNMILYGWRKGLKTLCYYLRVESSATADKNLGGITKKVSKKEIEGEVCVKTIDENGETHLSCCSA